MENCAKGFGEVGEGGYIFAYGCSWRKPTVQDGMGQKLRPYRWGRHRVGDYKLVGSPTRHPRAPRVAAVDYVSNRQQYPWLTPLQISEFKLSL